MPYKLLRATDDLIKDGVAYPGCPIFIHDGDICIAPSLFVMSIWVDCRWDTARTYAHPLKLWLTWLEFRRVDWWRVDVDDAQQYRSLMRQRLAPSSVNVAIAAICAFYDWAYVSGHILFRPFALSSSKKSGTAPLKQARIFKRFRKTLTKEQFETILAHSRRMDAGLLRRDELVAEFARSCGMRRSEVAGLTLGSIQGAEQRGEFYVFTLLNTKGGRSRSAYISRAFHGKVIRYIKVYRSAIADQYGLSSSAVDQPLFLTQYGKPLRREYASSSWSEASKAAGVKSRFHYHRHTMATRVITACEQAKLHPHRIAQDLLGHANHKTTILYDGSNQHAEQQDVLAAILDEVWHDKK